MTQQKRPIAIDDLTRIVDLEDPQVSPDERWIAYVQKKLDVFENIYRSTIWLAPTSGGAPIQLTRGDQDSQPRWSPDGATLAFTSARGGRAQLYLIKVVAPGGEAFALTSLPNGANSAVWSPDGSQIAFLSVSDDNDRAREDGAPEADPADKLEAGYRKDRRAQQEALRNDPQIANQIPYRDGYGQRLLDGRFAQLYVVAPEAGAKPRRLTGMQANFGVPAWTHDGQALLTFRPSDPFADEPSRLDRLHRIEVATGAETALNDEPFADRQPAASPDGQQIAYVRTPHEKQYTRVPTLALMPAAGGAAQDVSAPLDRSVLDPKWSDDSQTLYFRVNRDGNTEIARYNLAAGSIDIVVTGAAGDFVEVQGYSVGKGGGLAYVGATTTVPGELFWLPAGASTPQKLTNVNGDWLNSVIVQPVTEIRYPSYDGASVQGWYILPVGYEAGKRYPLIVHIHGGPRIMANPASKMFHEWQVYAAKGYVVFFANAHGSDGYGQEYQRKAYGMTDMPDTMAGVDALIERGYVDPERLSVTGGSYGGYATGWIVGNTGRFKAAIAERGVYNLLSHFGTTDYPYPTPQEFDANPWDVPMDAWNLSPLAHAHKITTPLMILHSENDFRVLISEAEQLFSYVRLSGKTPVQLVRFPREGHNLSRTGEPQHRVRRLELMTGWFAQHNPAD